jgi:hypothetical protein
MRKIPGVNTHIFKQPNIPWQEGYPYKLSPLLWLDATDLDYITLDGTDVNAFLDKSNTGADFVLGTAPTIDSTTNPTKVTFTSSNSEYLINTANISTFTSLSQGSIVYVNDNTTRTMFSLSDNSVDNTYVMAGVLSGKANLNINGGRPGWYVINSDTTVNIGDIVEWSSNGSLVTCKINGVLDTVTVFSGANTGQWLDSTGGTISSMTIGVLNRLSAIYYDTILKELIITSTPLTDAQSLDLANYLIGKHSL